MRRTFSHSNLPPLPRRMVRKASDSPSAALFRLLRQLALKNRKAQPQTFYSLREVAQNFDLPLSLFSRVFVLLENEGLLGRIRGSRTVLRGRKYDRNLRVRGVVGLPASFSQFTIFADHCSFNVEMRRQLRRRGFMPATVFFHRQEDEESLVAEHLLEAKSDTVVWFSPGPECRQAVEKLRDAGIRVIGVSDLGRPAIACDYEVRRQETLHIILREWRSRGLTSSVIVKESGLQPATAAERCRAASEAEKLPSSIVALKEGRVKAELARVCRREKRGIVLLAAAAALSALREPEAFWKMLRTRRVALVNGPMNLIFGNVPDVPADLLTVDWPAVVSRILDDLVAQESPAKPLRFPAQARLRVRLHRFRPIV